MSIAPVVRPACIDDLEALTVLFEKYRAFYKQVGSLY